MRSWLFPRRGWLNPNRIWFHSCGNFTGCPDHFCAIFTQSADTVLPPFTFCHFTEIAHVVVCHHHKPTYHPAGIIRFHHLILLGNSQPFISRVIRASSVNRNDLWRHIGRILSGEVANFAESENDFEACPQASCLRLVVSPG